MTNSTVLTMATSMDGARGGFDEECEDCEDDPVGCVFPGRCLMPGIHLESECHTIEMMETDQIQKETQ